MLLKAKYLGGEGDIKCVAIEAQKGFGERFANVTIPEDVPEPELNQTIMVDYKNPLDVCIVFDKYTKVD
jgi:hypothetical protein